MRLIYTVIYMQHVTYLTHTTYNGIIKHNQKIMEIKKNV